MVVFLTSPLVADERDVRTQIDHLAGRIQAELKAATHAAFDSFFAHLREHIFPRLLNADPQLKLLPRSSHATSRSRTST